MIVLKNLGQMKKINLWVNEEIICKDEILEVLQHSVVKESWIKWKDVSYVMELGIGHRHMSNYAMLGMKYQYKETGKLDIKICITSEEGRLIQDTIAQKGDEVHTGIPKEYGEEILNVATAYLNVHNCSAGELIFNFGAHGYCGSSQAVFGLVTSILLRYLQNNCESDINNMQRS